MAKPRQRHDITLVAPRVEKTEVFKKGWKFSKSDLFYELYNEKTFSIMDEINTVFSLFLALNYFLQR